MTAYARSTDPRTSWEAAETWKPIPGWEDLYEVSDHGKVRSLDRIDRNGRARKGRMLSPWSGHRGHLQVGLNRDGKRKMRMVHRLVLEAFVGPCPQDMEACHWDDDPKNNHLSNLRWDTRSANRYDAVRNGNDYNASKEFCIRGHRFSVENTYVDPTNRKRACRECRRATDMRFINKNREALRIVWRERARERRRKKCTTS